MLLDEYRTALTGAPETSNDEDIPSKAYWQEQIEWLTSRFPDGKYVDITGLCKVAKLDGEDGIKDQDYSLNPGRYVGVVIENDGMTQEEFKAVLLTINKELFDLNIEAQELEKTISDNIKSLVEGI